MFKKSGTSKEFGSGAAPKPSYTIPMPPLPASARYAPLLTAVELLSREPLTVEQKNMLMLLAETGSLNK